MKKIVASILVRNGLVVNSTNFSVYRPIGSVDQIVSRLQEWEVDEIVVLNLTHSENPLCDFFQLFSETLLGTIHTPIAYGGGITNALAAESVIAAGCERIVLSASRWTPENSREISVNLGDQSVLIHVPFVLDGSEVSVHKPGISIGDYLKSTPDNWGGELFLKDRNRDGATSRVDVFKKISVLARGINTPILAGGGVSSLREVEELMEIDCLKGIVIGNWFNRDELIIPKIKDRCKSSMNFRGLVRYR